MTQPDPLPDPVDMEKPSMARVYDYLLGGGHNFAVDREFAEQVLLLAPYVREVAIVNRSFLRRAVLCMVQDGIRQFLDLGSGIPTVGNVHEIAQRADPASRVVYVDYEPVAVAHTSLLLGDNSRAAIVHCDIAKADDVLNAPITRQLLDFHRPVGVLATNVFHYLPDDHDPLGAAKLYRQALAPGSYLALSHLGADLLGPLTDQQIELMHTTRDPVYPRTRDEIAEMFGPFELLEPGLVTAAHWRPEMPTDIDRHASGDKMYAGVARKR